MERILNSHQAGFAACGDRHHRWPLEASEARRSALIRLLFHGVL